GPSPVRLAVLLLVPATVAVSHWLQPAQFWTPVPAADPEAFRGLAITEPVVEAQGRLLADALAALPPPRPGRIEMYGATFAPYASQNVFLRESGVVTKTMQQRFDGRIVQLVTNNATSLSLPWATPSNLHRTITGIARVMDREHDVLFLHLTSHGGYDGKLATESWPLETEPVTPQQLRAWLDEAGIRWRVLSISACYSGSWIAPLAGEGTLVMTAADAMHTSYGCGSRSPLTFFGQAMYVDALNETLSFTEAHVKARRLIDEREKAAGKTDGYSNPQISEGAGIREVLERLAAQQER
uniref:C13 family peptidase n=1 Tax=Pelomonas sp. KK5 TaxID=1855730 RepID=UPI001E3E596F